MRCPRCGAEVKPGLGVCPQCGDPVRRARPLSRELRCRSCQSRVPSSLSICPYCGAKLKRSWRRPFQVLLILATLPVAAYLLMNYVPWAELRALPEQVRLPAIAFLVTPTFTASPSPTRTPTLTRTATPRFTPTAVPPTETPTLAPPTATRRPGPTRTPKPPFAAIRLLSPDNGAEIWGRDAQIKLSWESVGSLADDEWYALGLRFLAGGIAGYSGTWTKETSWIVPSDLYTKAGQSERAFQWDVVVMKQTGTKPDGGREGVALSPPSETRVFSWH